jgi:putative endonuclease
MTKLRRRRAYRRGRLSETLCRLFLRLKGYRILAAGFRVPVGEIDIVARRGKTLAIVEVKARASLAEAAEALTSHQQRRIARAAQAYLALHPSAAGLVVRFDVMLVRPWRLPHHLTNAWRL